MDRVAPTLTTQKQVESLLAEHGYSDYAWIRGSDVQVRQWVRFKCMFGCDGYGKGGACPPVVPSVEECRRFFSEYEHVVLIHFPVRVAQPDDRIEWSRRTALKLLKLERSVFLSGFHKVFLLFMDHCRLCADCTGTRAACKNPEKARPSPEALGVDVFTTVRAAGFPIQVLTDYSDEMNRYAFLLVE